jgi:hypothetical protein
MCVSMSASSSRTPGELAALLDRATLAQVA